MAWCLMAPSPYLNQWWLLISEVLQYAPQGNFTSSVWATILYNEIKNILLKLLSHLPGVSELIFSKILTIDTMGFSHPVWASLSSHSDLELITEYLSPVLCWQLLMACDWQQFKAACHCWLIWASLIQDWWHDHRNMAMHHTTWICHVNDSTLTHKQLGHNLFKMDFRI